MLTAAEEGPYPAGMGTVPVKRDGKITPAPGVSAVPGLHEVAEDPP